MSIVRKPKPLSVYTSLQANPPCDIFWHSIAANWSLMAARAQMEQVKLEEFNLMGMKSTKDWSTTYVLIQSSIKQLTPVVKQCFFHACSKSDHLQLRPEAAIMLQFLRCLGNVISWNIRKRFEAIAQKFIHNLSNL